MNELDDLAVEVYEMSDAQKRAMLYFMIGYCSQRDVKRAIEHARKVER